eukprot:scaffold327285_cov111-Tisochrysis_lutea.AAC.2
MPTTSVPSPTGSICHRPDGTSVIELTEVHTSARAADAPRARPGSCELVPHKNTLTLAPELGAGASAATLAPCAPCDGELRPSKYEHNWRAVG